MERFETYLRMIRRSDNTIKSYQGDVEDFLEWRKDKQLDGEEDALKGYINHLSTERNLKSSTINRKISSLNSYYDYLLYNKAIDKNPTDMVKLQISRFDVDNAPPKFVPMEQMARVIDSVTGVNSERDKAIIGVMSIMGLRVSEVCDLKIEDFKDGFISVLGKGNKTRRVPYTETVSNLIDSYLEKRPATSSPYLFVSRRTGDKMTTRAVGHCIDKISEASGVDLHPHMFRHTFATYFYKETKDLGALQDILGHSDPATTRVYAHILDEDYKLAAMANPMNECFS